MAEQQTDYEVIGFDEEVEGSSFQQLPDGLYLYTYLGYITGNHAADQYDDHNYPTAIVKLKLENAETHEEFETQETFKMIKKAQWKIHRFFESMGIVKNPETGKIKPAWQSGIGRTGAVELETSEFKKNDGTTGKYQQKNFLTAEAYEEKLKAKKATQPTQPQQNAAQTQPNQWNTGKFKW